LKINHLATLAGCPPPESERVHWPGFANPLKKRREGGWGPFAEKVHSEKAEEEILTRGGLSGLRNTAAGVCQGESYFMLTSLAWGKWCDRYCFGAIFDNFLRKKLAFFSKTNVMIIFLKN
jgi:hypothetical protein